MAYLLLDQKFIDNHPKLYQRILKKVSPEKIEQLKHTQIVKISFHSDKIPDREVAMIRIRDVDGYLRLGAIERTDRPFVQYQ